jgi:uncharacterized protein YkuJ
MTQALPLGAINKQTGDYVYPKIANKKDEYVCPECNKDLILCQGEIKRHHFRHKVDSVNPCHHHYSNPTETQIHKDGKMAMKYLLERKIPISFIRNCCSCKKSAEINLPEITEGSKIELEYRFEYNGTKIADVAYIDNDDVFCVFEIYSTHKTSSGNRPEPWFEIDAETLIKLANDNSVSHIKIPCIRCEKCGHCIEKELERKYKIRNEVERKSSENESDSYCCHSKDIMNIMITLICGDDCYDDWCSIYRRDRSDFSTETECCDGTQSEYKYYHIDDDTGKIMDDNINIGYMNDGGGGHRTYYDKTLIQEIQQKCLYKYLYSFDVNHGRPEFIFNVIHYDDELYIDKNLKLLCEKLLDESCIIKFIYS